MRKRLIAPVHDEVPSPDQEWLILERLAEVEVTSDEARHPIESAFGEGRW
jgi:hypothetical protein